MSSRERIALFDGAGRVIGAKERALAYADGERVGLVFVWAVWKDEAGKGQMLLQTRSRPNDPYLGSLDAPAGGHIQEGEEHAETARREFAEEVGLLLAPEQLLYMGCLALVDPQARYWRRAMQFFYVCTRPIALTETVFNEEVQAFVQVELHAFAELVHGDVEQITGHVHSADAPGEIIAREISSSAFAAYSAAIMDAICRSARGLQAYIQRGTIDESVWRI
jgi:8-oxo-dGTP pyrophosphatase MutT (NUDIX family)